MIKKHFNKKPVKTKEDDKDFENSTKCWICDNVYVDGDVKATVHCHTTGKYRDSSHLISKLNLMIKVLWYSTI